MGLTRQQRADLPGEDFAVPAKRKIAIHDAEHVRMAWENIGAAAGLTDDERKDGRKRIIARAKEFDMDVSAMERGRIAGSWSLAAMALNIENGGHANKMPFSGVLTFVDRPSDSAPKGSHGRRVTITKECADKALPTLMGMAVNYAANFDGHDPKAKIGIITSADVVDGKEIHVGGFIYASDFPDIAAEIKANKDLLGFSYEAREIFTDDPDANPVRITDCVFTGAAILLKDKAAYRNTSLAAKAAGDMTMDEEVKKAFEGVTKLVTDLVTPLAEQFKTLSASVEEMKTKPGQISAKAEAHAKRFDDIAAEMAKDGMDASLVQRQAAYIRAEGAQGRLVTVFPADLAAASDKSGGAAKLITDAVDAAVKPLKDQIAAQDTTIKDLKAAKAKDTNQPERKTLAPAISALLAKAGITLPTEGSEDQKVPLGKIDEALKGLPIAQRMTVKDGLAKAGIID